MLKRSLQAEMTLYLRYNSGDQFNSAVVIFAGKTTPDTGAYPASLDLTGLRTSPTRHVFCRLCLGAPVERGETVTGKPRSGV